jgi:hypothetical protein
MAKLLNKIISKLFSIPYLEADFCQRGFHIGDPVARERLERIGMTFLEGYHAALEEYDFSYEGAAMALTLLDFLTPWAPDRFRRFLDRAGTDHIYMLHVGAGWALARLHRSVNRFLSHLDPVLGWLVVDAIFTGRRRSPNKKYRSN